MTPPRHSKRTEKLQLMLNLEELQMIEDWRFANRMPTRSAAVRALMRRSLEQDAELLANSASAGKPASNGNGHALNKGNGVTHQLSANPMQK